MNSRPAEIVLQDAYLETRAKLLEVAAVLDRIDRAESASSSLPSDAKVARDKLVAAIELLLNDSPDRAEKIQQLFSRQYDPQWRSEFGLKEGN